MNKRGHLEVLARIDFYTDEDWEVVNELNKKLSETGYRAVFDEANGNWVIVEELEEG